jgi:hypothetical protein
LIFQQQLGLIPEAELAVPTAASIFLLKNRLAVLLETGVVIPGAAGDQS